MGTFKMEVNTQTIKNADLVNNVFTANRDIGPSQIVLQLPAVVSGPGRGTKPVCLGCFGTEDLKPCSTCTWPVCSAKCEKSELHQQECAILTRSGVKCKIDNFNGETNELDFITPLRLILKLRANKDFKDLFDKTKVTYADVKDRNIEVYNSTSDAAIIKFISETVKSGYETEEIEKAIAIIEKFAMRIGNGCCFVYKDLQDIEHSCSPNTYHMIQTSKEIVFRASFAIKKGSVITFCKTDMTKCNLFRRRLLKKLFISCECKRCLDGTEFGSGFGSVQCKDCEGFISSSDSRNEGAEWKCGGCNKKSSGKECVALLDEMNNKLITLTKSADDNKETIHDFEQLLLSRGGEWKQLPFYSQLFLDMTYSLIYIYGYHPQYYKTGEDNAKVKFGHCNNWLEQTQKIFPGRNYIKVMIDFERINSAVSVMHDMRRDGHPTEEVNSFIAEINSMGIEPLDFTKEDEEPSLCNAIKQTLMIATEAREEQRKRIIINMWADEDQEDW